VKRFTAEGLEGGFLYWGPWVMKGRFWRRASLFMGGSVGQTGVGSSTGDFERWLKGALEMKRLSRLELCKGNLEGGLPFLGTLEGGRKGSRDGHLSS